MSGRGAVLRTTPPALHLSMGDIAALARVRRPVVSMWRTRTASTDDPFPGPMSGAPDRQVFDGREVADWLARTHHGNNPAARDDVAAFAVMADASHRRDVGTFDALTAALTLKVITGRPLADMAGEDLLDVADECDPDDDLLFSELEAVGDRLGAIARYADLVADAAVSPAAAFETLLADRFRQAVPEHAATRLDSTAVGLVAELAVQFGARDEGPTVYADVSPGSSDLLVAVAAEHGDRGPIEVMTPSGGDRSARLVRRRLRVHDIYRTDVQVDDDGTFAIEPTVTHVAQFPSPGASEVSDERVLAGIDHMVLQMDDEQRGVVIGPVRALSDGFGDSTVEGLRASLLRTGRVRAIVRLPAGLVPVRPRQVLGLWVLGASHADVDPGERLTMVADLADERLSDDVVDELVTDLVAASGGSALVRGHTFRHAYPVLTRTLLAADRSLVEVRSTTPRSEHADGIATQARIEQVRSALTGVAVLVPDLGGTQPTGPSPRDGSTIGDMLERRRLRLIPGNRVEQSDLWARDGFRVLGVPELTGDSPVGRRRLERLVLAADYGAVRLTEPGDVVFCTSPRPRALVDREGSAVVVYPARVLRVDAADPDGVQADVLAADIRAYPAHARQWRRWRIRRVRDADLRALSDSLAELDRARAATAGHLAHLDELTDLIIAGTTSGSLTLHPPTDSTRGH